MVLKVSKDCNAPEPLRLDVALPVNPPSARARWVHEAKLSVASALSPDAQLRRQLLSPAPPDRQAALTKLQERMEKRSLQRRPAHALASAATLEHMLIAPDGQVRTDVAHAIGKLVCEAADSRLYGRPRHPDLSTHALITGWAHYRNLHDQSNEVFGAKGAIRDLVAKLKPAKRDTMLALLLQTRQPGALRDAVSVLLEHRRYDAIEAVLRTYDNDLPDARRTANESVIDLCRGYDQHRAFTHKLCRSLLADKDPQVRSYALKELPIGAGDAEHFWSPLLAACHDPDLAVQFAAKSLLPRYIAYACIKDSSLWEHLPAAHTAEVFGGLSLRNVQALLDGDGVQRFSPAVVRSFLAALPGLSRQYGDLKEIDSLQVKKQLASQLLGLATPLMERDADAWRHWIREAEPRFAGVTAEWVYALVLIGTTSAREAVASECPQALAHAVAQELQRSFTGVDFSLCSIVRQDERLHASLTQASFAEVATLRMVLSAGCRAWPGGAGAALLHDLGQNVCLTRDLETFVTACALTAQSGYSTERDAHLAKILNAPGDEAANLAMLTRLSLRDLEPYRAVLLETFKQRHLTQWCAMDAKTFDAEDPVHLGLAYLRMLDQPHTFKLLTEQDFTFADMRRVIDAKRGKGAVVPLTHEALETAFLGYEAHLLHKEVIAPALLRARALGRPVMLVANFTYGGTAITGLPLHALRQAGVRLVGTKQGSSEAHTNRDALTPQLFSAEDVRFMVSKQPLVIVVDGSPNQKIPDAFRGYRNFVTVLNSALGQGRLPNADFGDARWHLSLSNYVREVAQPGTLPQQVKVFNTSLPLGRQETRGFTLEKSNLDMFTTLHDWQQVTGPAFICVQVGTPVSALEGRDDAATRAVMALPDARNHAPASFDDNAQAQAPHVYVGQRGVRVKPLMVHAGARAFYKKVDQL